MLHRVFSKESLNPTRISRGLPAHNAPCGFTLQPEERGVKSRTLEREGECECAC